VRVSVVVLTASAVSYAATPIEKQTLFEAGKGGYVLYRIPGITVTPGGTILVHCEGRQGAGDWTQQDIILRRSTDGGKTWSKPTVVSKRPPNLVPSSPPIRPWCALQR